MSTTSNLQNQSSLIKLSQVVKNFAVRTQEIKVLKGVDLEIEHGEFIMIIGPSGSGKSTLLNIVTGLERPTSGSSVLFGIDTKNASEDDLANLRRKYVGIVYQQSNWIKSISVLENVAFPLLLHGVPKHQALTQARQALDTIGLGEWSSFKPTELSGGQQQRVAVARALVIDPQLIIADEPTGNLDYASGQALMQLLKKLQQEGRTIVMVTHDLENVTFASRVMRVLDGNIIESFDPSEYTQAELVQRIATNKAAAATLLTEGEPEVPLKNNPAELAQRLRRRLRFNPLGAIRNLPHVSREVVKEVKNVIRTFILVLNSLVVIMLGWLMDKLRIGAFSMQVLKFSELVTRFAVKFRREEVEISHSELINLSIKSMMSHRSRSIVTIGGVAVGIGFTVFLISLGYGLERLVIGRVANLEQLRHIDVSPPISDSLKMNDEVVNDFSRIVGVDQVLPLVELAGKASYSEANVDVAVYGVQADYLVKSFGSATAGNFFTSNNLVVPRDTTTPAEIPGGVAAGQTQEPKATNVLSAGEPNPENPNLVIATIPDYAAKEMVANPAFLKLVNLTIDDAVDKQIILSMIATSNILDEDKEVQTAPTAFRLVGVLDTGDSPIIYIPALDAKSVGIGVYSHIRLVASDQAQVANIRQQIEVAGYRTSSILDTVRQIEGVFATVRAGFAGLGFIALLVASFGMFNTLTVSLLERTREVGLMKAIGMRSSEIKDLFLSESIMMGILGGVFGVLTGLVCGVALSAGLTMVALSRGMGGGLVVNQLPIGSAVAIMVVAAGTGLLTGAYPSRRATKISVLDAMRYE